MEFMTKHTRESLDVEYVLNMITPKTPYGIQKKKELKPFKTGEEELLRNELDETEQMQHTSENYKEEFRQLSYIFEEIKEIRGSIKRAYEGLVLDEVELFEIKNFIFCIRDLSSIQKKIKNLPQSVRLYRAKELEELLDPENSGGRTFYIYDLYSEKLKTIREEIRSIQRQFETERKRIITSVEDLLGVRIKLSGEFVINKKEEDKIERAKNCPYISEESSTMLSSSFRLKNSEKLEQLSFRLEKLKYEEESEEFEVRKSITDKIQGSIDIINDLIDKVGRLDFLIAKVIFASKIDGIKPVIYNETSIVIKDGRHLRVEASLNKKGREFTCLSFTVAKGVTVITGANMGGKTVSLKLAGMLCTMAQYGLFVPAVEFKTCLFNYIYFSIGDMQSLDTGLSTFGSEISSMIEILKHSSSRGLILIDELARGTNPKEGYAISRAIVNYLKTTQAVTLFTTHFDGITMEEGVEHLQVRGLKDVNFEKLADLISDEKTGIDMVFGLMDYSLEKIDGKHNVPMDAINIAKLMGLDDNILKNAEKMLSEGKEEKNG